MSKHTDILEEIRDLLKNAGFERPERETNQSLFRRMIQIIKPLPEDDGTDPVVIRAVTVLVANTPVQGPDIKIPAAWIVVVRQRIHAGAPVGRVAASRNAITNPSWRTELEDGESVMMNVINMDDLWFDSDTADTAFEIIAQRPIVETVKEEDRVGTGILAGAGAQRNGHPRATKGVVPAIPSVR